MTTQTIFRVANRYKPFSQLSNSMLRDGRLTYEARGVLAFILTLPPDWQFNLGWLLQEGNLGRDRALKVIKLLTDVGYCEKTRKRNKDGTLGHNEFVFSDDPHPDTEIQDVDVLTKDWNPVDGEPQPDFQYDGTNKEITNKQTNPPLPPVEKSGVIKSDFGSEGKRPAPIPTKSVSVDGLENVRLACPGWDKYFLLAEYRNWGPSKTAHDPDAHFLAFAKGYIRKHKLA